MKQTPKRNTNSRGSDLEIAPLMDFDANIVELSSTFSASCLDIQKKFFWFMICVHDMVKIDLKSKDHAVWDDTRWDMVGQKVTKDQLVSVEEL